MILMDGTIFPGVCRTVMATLFVYLLLSFEVIAPRISNRTISLINRCNIEAGQRTAKYLLHRLPDELEELIYIRSALDTDGNFSSSSSSF